MTDCQYIEREKTDKNNILYFSKDKKKCEILCESPIGMTTLSSKWITKYQILTIKWGIVAGCDYLNCWLG